MTSLVLLLLTTTQALEVTEETRRSYLWMWYWVSRGNRAVVASSADA